MTIEEKLKSERKEKGWQIIKLEPSIFYEQAELRTTT
jgi:hypothetical protein